jgi:hypothetical protein
VVLLRIGICVVTAAFLAFLAVGTLTVKASPGVPMVRVSHDSFVGHVEPTLAVDPSNPNHLLAAAQVVPPSAPAGDRRQLGTFVSFNGGRTWQSNGALPGSSPLRLGLDVTVAFDRRGQGYVVGEEQQSLTEPVAPLYVWRAVAGGRSFSRPVLVAGGPGCCDHAWVAVDQSSGPHAGTIYVAYTTETAVLVRSSADGGRHWSQGTAVPVPSGVTVGDHPIGPVASVGADGGLHVAFYAPPSDKIVVASSDDGGVHFRASVVPGRASGIPGLSAASNGSVYVTFPSPRGFHQVVSVASSPDGGRSWRSPVTLAVPGGVNLSQPALASANDGKVYVSFFATGAVANEYLASSRDRGAHFSVRRITPSGFDPAKGLSTGKGGPFVGDYQALAATAKTVYPLWNDTRTGRLELFTALVPAG